MRLLAQTLTQYTDHSLLTALYKRFVWAIVHAKEDFGGFLLLLGLFVFFFEEGKGSLSLKEKAMKDFKLIYKVIKERKLT